MKQTNVIGRARLWRLAKLGIGLAAVTKLLAAFGVWNDKVIPSPETSVTDEPTESPLPSQPLEEPKGEESTEALASQVEDLMSSDSSVFVRVFGADVAAVDSIVVSKETDPAALASLSATYPGREVDLYDIKTLDASGQFIQIGGEAQVTLPVAPGRVVEKVIYFLPSTGAVEELPFEWNQLTNGVSFKVSHFSHYGLV